MRDAMCRARSAFGALGCLLLAATLLGDGPASGASGGALAPLDPALFDRAAAAHLLSRAGFGGTGAEIDALHALGLEKAVESFLDPTRAESAPPFTPSATGAPGRRELSGLSKEERQKQVRSYREEDARQFQALRGWWIRRMALTTRPLVEKMVLFWHGHFATSQREVRNSYLMHVQNELFRKHALGSFRDLTRAVAKDPAMLEYLDNNQNVRRKPNENFARELLELFTLGVGNYSETDVKEAARALTGWTFRGNEFVFDRRRHDPGEKAFLGRTGAFDGDAIIDIVFEQPQCSRFIARKLFVFFAHEDPSPEIVEELARELRDSGFQVASVLRRLLRCSEFYSPRARGNRVKSPVELVVGTLRLLGMDPGAGPAVAGFAGRMGQDIFLPPNVKGWDGGRAWISTKTLFDRYEFSRVILGIGEADGRRPPAKKKKDGPPRARGPLPPWDASAGAAAILGPDFEKLAADALVEKVIRHFLGAPLPEEPRRKLIEFCAGASAEARLRGLIHLVLSSPEYQLG